MPYYQFHKHLFNLRRLLQGCGLLHNGAGGLHTLLLLGGTSLLGCLFLTVVAYESVECVDERGLVESHSHRTIVDVGVAQDGVDDKRYAAQDGVYRLGTFQRVALVLKQKVGLKLYEVGLIVLYVFAEIRSRMLFGERVGIVAVGQ